MRKKLTLALSMGVVALLGLAGSALLAFTQPAFVNTDIDACRLPVTNPPTPLPPTLICADAWYTDGNLGKSWNELDLVPHRLTTSLGNQAGATTTYNVYIAADYKDGGYLGYDVISVPVVNAAKSDASCSVSAGPQQVTSGVTGGTDETVYRELTITQNKDTTCVFDWYQRLAIGASKFAGSNLQSYLFEQSGLQGGKETIPIPVKEIQPQELSKTMSASRDAETMWNITKVAEPGSIDFGDVCKATSFEKPVEVTVTWTKGETSPTGDVTVITNINVKNPAARSITVNVTDTIYVGDGSEPQGAQLGTQSFSNAVPAFYNGLFKTFTYTIPAAVADANSLVIGSYLNDVAVASYTDEIAEVPVPGTTTATANAQIQLGTTVNETVNVADLEEISGSDWLKFKVADPGLLGSAFVGYTPGDLATSVSWGVTGLTATGSVKFMKQVVLAGKYITTGELSDIATLVSTDNQFIAQATLIPISISSSARVELTVAKKIPLALNAGEKVVTLFTVTPAVGSPFDVQVTHAGPSGIPASAQTTVGNLDPTSYTVVEGTSTFYSSPADVTGTVLPFVPDQGSATVNLSPKANGLMDETNCSGTVSFVNSVPLGNLPVAKVAKITLPTQVAGDDGWAWVFTLYGPNGPIENQTAYAGQGMVAFTELSDEGNYYIQETAIPKWDLTSIAPPAGGGSDLATRKCTFAVDFPSAYGKTFECTFTNTKRGAAKVIKTVQGQPPSEGQTYVFELRQGASATQIGTTLETQTANVSNGGILNFAYELKPDPTVYQMCEHVAAGWMTTLGSFVPGGFMPPDGATPNPNVDNSIICVDFTVQPGEIKTFTVDNTPPPGGRALTIGFWKNHGSCAGPLNKTNALALDETLYDYLPLGILTGSKIVSLVTAAPGFGFYGQNATSTADCAHAVQLLDKRDFGGKKQASDPLYNMAAQLVAAQLNLAAGAYTCPAVALAVAQANNLLGKYNFTGFGYTKPLSKPDATLANTLATKLDNYNNNRPGVCP